MIMTKTLTEARPDRVKIRRDPFAPAHSAWVPTFFGKDGKKVDVYVNFSASGSEELKQKIKKLYPDIRIIQEQLANTDILFRTTVREAMLINEARLPSQLRGDDLSIYEDPKSGDTVVFYPADHGMVWCCYGDSLEDMDPGDAEEMTAKEADQEASGLKFKKVSKGGALE